jgi:hypothetical protein
MIIIGKQPIEVFHEMVTLSVAMIARPSLTSWPR